MFLWGGGWYIDLWSVLNLECGQNFLEELRIVPEQVIDGPSDVKGGFFAFWSGFGPPFGPGGTVMLRC